MYLEVFPLRGFVTDRSSVRLSFGGGSRRWLSGIRVGPFAAAAAAAVADAPAAVVATAAAAGVALAWRPRLGIRTPGWAEPAVLGVVAEVRVVADDVAACAAVEVSNAAGERCWSAAVRATEELLAAPVDDAVGVLAPVLDTKTVVYQNTGFTPAWSVSEWWLARTGCRDRRSA